MFGGGSLGFFLVNDYYDLIPPSCMINLVITDDVLLALRLMWKIKIPSKSILFGWRFLLNHLVFRVHLFKCCFVLDSRNLCCPLCMRAEEDLEHLFGGCRVSLVWWIKMCDWINVDFLFGNLNILVCLSFLEASIRSRFLLDSGSNLGYLFVGRFGS